MNTQAIKLLIRADNPILDEAGFLPENLLIIPALLFLSSFVIPAGASFVIPAGASFVIPAGF